MLLKKRLRTQLMIFPLPKLFHKESSPPIHPNIQEGDIITISMEANACCLSVFMGKVISIKRDRKWFHKPRWNIVLRRTYFSYYDSHSFKSLSLWTLRLKHNFSPSGTDMVRKATKDELKEFHRLERMIFLRSHHFPITLKNEQQIQYWHLTR